MILDILLYFGVFWCFVEYLNILLYFIVFGYFGIYCDLWVEIDVF